MSAPNMGPGEMGMGTENTMSIVNWDKSIEKPNGGDFSSLTGRGSESVALLSARILAADAEETLEEGDSLLNSDGTVASSSNDERSSQYCQYRTPGMAEMDQATGAMIALSLSIARGSP